jgi:hypothetical protein
VDLFLDGPHNLRDRLLSRLHLGRPCTAWVEFVPEWPRSAVAVLARIVQAEAGQHIPDRTVLRDHQLFRERHPDVLDHEIAAPEIGEIEVACRGHGATVLADPRVKNRPSRRAEVEAANSPALWKRLADVQRNLRSGYIAIRRKRSLVVDRIDAGADKRRLRRERMKRTCFEVRNDALAQRNPGERVERLLNNRHRTADNSALAGRISDCG